MLRGLRDSVSDVADDVASVRGLLPDVAMKSIGTGSGKYGSATFWVTRGVAHLNVNWTSTGTSSYQRGDICTIPSGYRPPLNIEVPAVGNDGIWASKRSIIIDSDTGKVTWQNCGGDQSMRGARALLVW